MYHTQPPKAGETGWIYSLNDSIILWVHFFFFNLAYLILSVSIINHYLLVKECWGSRGDVRDGLRVFQQR